MNVRVAKCLLVAKVLVADGMMTENERSFLEVAMTHLKLDADDRQKVLDLEGLDDAELVVMTLPEKDRREFLSTLVDAASADGKLSPLEAATVKRITAALGLQGG